jgi:oligopeptide/dipeptide ABC transporter ATP-binding protein
MSDTNRKKLLEVNRLSVDFHSNEGRIQAVRDVSFYIRTGEIIGVVGESGSGKTVTTSSMLGWITNAPGIVSGKITYYDEDEQPDVLVNVTSDKSKSNSPGKIISEYDLNKKFKEIRKKDITMIFQEPKRYLHPYWTVEKHFAETIKGKSKEGLYEASKPYLETVGLSIKNIWMLFPHNLSGGMNQRLMISLALSRNPRLLIADEMTTGLDVTTQVKISDMLSKLIADAEDENRAIVLISHDIAFVIKIVNVLMVMYAGDIVEFGPAHLFYDEDQEDNHPYTNALLDVFYGRSKKAIEGDVPSSVNPPAGCPFRERNCKIYDENHEKIGRLCETSRPKKYFPNGDKGHWVRCHKFITKPWSNLVSD